MNQEEFIQISSKIPVLPGIYKYFDSTDKLIYVGKAKNLKKRVSSYFNKTITNQKTIELVKKIDHIEFTIVDTEEDAFFLESSLIKEYQPHYNINLKDGKGYPYVVIKNESFSRVFFTRKKINDGSEYFGPYSSILNAREIIEFVKQVFPFRTCTLNLSSNNISKKKFKVCLEYHLGNCKGPCEGLQSQEEYLEGLSQLKSLLKGNLQPLLIDLKNKIKEHTSKLEFEKAAFYQNKIYLLSAYQAKSAVVNTKIGETDVFSIVEEGNLAYVNYMSVNNGNIIRTKTIFIEKKMEETVEQVLSYAISQLREDFKSNAKEIIVPFEIHYPEKEIKTTYPKSGDKKKLLELSQKNANYFLNEIAHQKRLHLEDKNNDEREQLLVELQLNLRLTKIPRHIECFDNSNLQGSNAVAAMVCFKNGLPFKNDYRRFKIKTVSGIDDFSSMKEIVFRRYSRIIKENAPLPDLIIIDGGKGQLNAALQSIKELGIIGKTTLVGLAKNKEELFFANDQESILLEWNSDSLKMIRRIRDEVHRFGITFHRNLRSKNALENELETIIGIGDTTAKLLLSSYKSVKKISSVSFEELKNLIGNNKAEIITNYFKNKIP
jgi:excinuclease ABC subunit C